MLLDMHELMALSAPLAVAVLAVAAVWGAVFGSFVNCLAWRLVHGENPWKGRSHCAVCGHELAAFDLVPILSWLFLRGRCRYCGQPISVRYTLAELLLAVYFASMVWVYGLSVYALALCALGCLLLGLSLVDLDSYIIPNGFIIAGIVLWVLSVAFYGLPAHGTGLGSLFAGLLPSPLAAVVADGLAGAFGIACALLLFSIAFEALTGKVGLGGGDLKLIFMAGLYLGLAASVLNLLVACVLGLLFNLLWAGAHPQGDPQAPVPRAFPFGPAISAAVWLTLLFGAPVLDAYLGLFL
ncbi:MAG: prepilin peptidase [Coriobacteriales bacterium]